VKERPILFRVKRLPKYIEWKAYMTLGWICNQWIMRKSDPIELTPLTEWALAWAGFYSYDTGFDDWFELCENRSL
jgi:hypothetical protein